VRISGWRAALRIARREAWRAKARSVLVIALIGLPIFALASADVVYRTWQLNAGQRITRQIGSADAWLQWVGGDVKQSATADASMISNAGTGSAPGRLQLLAALPPGSRAIVDNAASGVTRVRTRAGIAETRLVGLDYTDPIAHGLVRQVSGRAPRSASEVALTTALARMLNLRVGDSMHTVAPIATLNVVGIVADASYRDDQTAYTLASAVPVSTTTGVGPTWLIRTPGPVTWAQVQGLNRLGYLVVSRFVYLHSPHLSDIPAYESPSPTVGAQVLASGAVVSGMALLEIVLLAGPAFAVGARRQRRDLALVAAVGGNRSQLRNVVLSTGIVLGAAAGLVSVLAALAAAAIAVPVLSGHVDKLPGPFDVHPVDLLVLATVGLVTALAAAVFPARAAARLDVMAALAGRRGTVTTRKRIPVIGAVIAAIGVLVAFGAVTAATNASVFLAGIALGEIGLVMCTPSMLGLAARAGTRLPLSGRIAVRDAARNRSSAAPAVAAVMASVIGAVAIVLGVSSANDQDRRNYLPTLAMNEAYVGLNDQTSPNPAQVAAVLRAKLPADSVVVVDQPEDACAQMSTETTSCTSTTVTAKLPAGLRSRYRGGGFPGVLIDDGSGVSALFAASVPAAVAALRSGEAVVVDPGALHAGTLTLTLTKTTTSTTATTLLPDQARDIVVPAVAVTDGVASTQVILPPALARQLGIDAQPISVLARDTSEPTDAQQQAVRAALRDIGSDGVLYVETGFVNPSAWQLYALVAVAVLIAVGAAIIATALTNADSRPDLVTLAAIGASPRTRRRLSLARAAVVSGIGTAVGAVAGFVPALAWVHSAHRVPSIGLGGGGFFSGDTQVVRLHLVVPWLPIVVLLLAIPVLAAVIAGLTTRSRLPSERVPA
jgi:putative ABC transport system permease protein